MSSSKHMPRFALALGQADDVQMAHIFSGAPILAMSIASIARIACTAIRIAQGARKKDPNAK